MTIREVLKKKGFTDEGLLAAIKRNARSFKTPPHIVVRPTVKDYLPVQVVRESLTTEVRK